MNEINGHQYTDLGYSHEELKELLSKINKGKVLTPAQYDMLINTIKIENISTFSGEYSDLKNTPDIPKIVNDIIRSLNKTNADVAAGSVMAINIPVGAMRVVIAYEATVQDLTSVLDKNDSNANIVSGFGEP